MGAKSEVSMPMSRALAKLAVATDLGTAARPSTAVALSWSAVSTAGACGSGGGKAGLVAMAASGPSGRHLKPSAARNVQSALPLPLPLKFPEQQQQQHQQQKQLQKQQRDSKATAVEETRSENAGGRGGGSATASGTGTSSTSSTPRLPPLPSAHNAPPPSPRGLTTSTAVTVTAAATQPPQMRQSYTLPSPLPPCGVLQTPLNNHKAHGPNGLNGASTGFIKELQDAARKHPGLPASLLAQLNHTRRPGAPSSAPSAATAVAAITSPPPPSTGAGGDASNCVRPLSPRSRARLTASLVNGIQAAVLPPPPSMAAMSPEALAVLLGAPSQAPPATPGGGLLVMKRAAPSLVGAGAALRPSTAQQGGGGSGSSGVALPGSASVNGSSPARPAVVPHMTVPYKPGSIRLPMGGVPGITAAVAVNGTGGSKGSSGPATAVGSPATGTPAVQNSTMAAAAATASEVLRPWTAATTGGGGGGGSAFRPVTANPLTHAMPAETSGSIVVRVPRSAVDAPLGSAPLLSPSHTGSGSFTAGRTAAATTARSGAAVSASGSAAYSGCISGEVQDSRQLTAQELRAVVVALAAARPEAAASLLQRPAAAAMVAGSADGGDVSAHSRRPTTCLTGAPAAAAAAAHATTAGGTLWEKGSLHSTALPAPSGPSRGSSQASTRGSLLSAGELSFISRDPSVFEDKWPRPISGGGSRPGSRGCGGTATDAVPSNSAGASTGDCGVAAATGSRGGTGSSLRPAISAWGFTGRALESILEDEELPDGDEVSAGDDSSGGRSDVRVQPIQPLGSLEPDPELETSWANIVAANQRPDTAAMRTSAGGINVFSRVSTGAPRVTRQAAPMVLVLEDITASTPEVLDRELAHLSLEELQALRTKLCA